MMKYLHIVDGMLKKERKFDIKDFDISAKNPNKNETIEHKSPIELVENIKLNNAEINDLMDEIETI